jgi:hypothetical protein
MLTLLLLLLLLLLIFPSYQWPYTNPDDPAHTLPHWCLAVVSNCATWALWLLLLILIVWGGVRVAGAARELAIPAAAVYAAVVIWLLHKI